MKKMTIQQKIEKMERDGKKVKIYAHGPQGLIVIGNYSFDSIDQAYKYYYGK